MGSSPTLIIILLLFVRIYCCVFEGMRIVVLEARVGNSTFLQGRQCAWDFWPGVGLNRLVCCKTPCDKMEASRRADNADRSFGKAFKLLRKSFWASRWTTNATLLQSNMYCKSPSRPQRFGLLGLGLGLAVLASTEVPSCVAAVMSMKLPGSWNFACLNILRILGIISTISIQYSRCLGVQ